MADNPNQPEKQLYVSWASESDKRKALTDLALYTADEGVFRQKATASRNMSYKNVDSNINVKPTFSRDNYDFFRPEETTPKRRKEVIALCEGACEKVGLIKNVVDLMGDFASQGIDIIHKDDKAQRVIAAWAKRINLKDRAERFLNMLYSVGTVGVLRQTATLNNIDLKRIQELISPNNVEIDNTRPTSDIPIGYNYIHPNSLEIIGGDIALFGLNKPKYGLRLPDPLIKKIKAPGSDIDRAIIDNLPDEIVSAATTKELIPMGDNFSIHFYKKKDWQPFPLPMIYAILDDVIMLEKLKLADIAACDGAISSVRLWRLGSLEHKILPTPAAVSKLSEILSNNVGGGSYDLIWDATLDFKESSSDISKFLGEEKYVPTLNRIYAGLGIPPTLTGSSTTSGFTNNYISLKTLTERLEYGRSVLIAFLDSELSIIQKALGLREPFQVIFDRMTLSDEVAEKKLFIDLLDRNIISDETVLKRFGEFTDIERSRLKSETKLRDEKELPEKASPYHSQNEAAMKQTLLQTGQVTPSQVGVTLKPKKPNEKTLVEINNEHSLTKKAIQKKKPKGKPGEGRPLNSKDSNKRQRRTVKPRGSASFVDISFWAKETQSKISELLMPGLLNHYGKTTARALSDKELSIVEQIKFEILTTLSPLSKISDEVIYDSVKAKINEEIVVVYNNLVAGFIQNRDKELTIDEKRQLYIYAYSLYHQGEIDNGNV